MSWQVFALMARDQINEQLQQAEQRRRYTVTPPAPREPRHLHLPAALHRSVRPSSRHA